MGNTKNDKEDNHQKEVLDVISSTVFSGISEIPGVGSFISSMYFDYKSRVRFRRLKKYYKELSYEVKQIIDRLATEDKYDKEAITAIIEEINEKVEREYKEEKIKYLKNYFKNTLIDPINKENFDERRFFLDTLSVMTTLECDIMVLFIENNNKKIEAKNIKSKEVDSNNIIGAIERLRNYGFLNSETKSISFGKDESLGKIVNLNEFGLKFFNFCIEDV